MHYSYLLLAALPTVFAQYGGDSSSNQKSSSSSVPAPTGTGSSTKGVQTILVGSPKTLAITPNNIKAEVGSVVEFVFYPKTHSIAQASFAEPCAPLANNTGFFSGPQTTTSGENAQVFAITVNNTKPIWFYCAFPGHCQGGMVGVINAPADGSKTVEQFIAAAAKVATTVSPAKIQGGFLGAASAVVVPSGSGSSSPSPSGSGTSTSSGSGASTSSSGSSTKNGASALSMQWSVSITGLLAVAVAGLML